MLKIRVQGLPEEVREFEILFKTLFQVHQISAPYKNRGESEYVRVYIDCTNDLPIPKKQV